MQNRLTCPPEVGCGLPNRSANQRSGPRTLCSITFFPFLIAFGMAPLPSDGMATVTYRTTFALDEGTTRRIKSLARLWKVSQAEVVR